MSQDDYVIENASGAAVRADLNNALAAIVSQNSGATAPTTTFAYQWWADTTTGLLKIRNAANSAWITIGTLAAANLGLLSLAGGALTGALNEAQGADIASAATTDIGAATGNFVNITGAVTITALGTIQAGTRRVVKFAGALTLTYNATSLILPTAANITTAAGDVAAFISLGSGNWICTGYLRADGSIPAAAIHGLAAKTTLVSADEFMVWDSAASALKKVTLTNMSASFNSSVTQQDKSGAYTLVAGDKGTLVNFTGSTGVTFAFTAAATLGSGWWGYIKNGGTAAAVVTLDPNASETIDGSLTLALNPGDVRLVMCNGTLFTTIAVTKNTQSGLLLSTQYITSSQTVNAVAGAANYDVIAIGAGGGSSNLSTGTASGGGGSGGYCRKLISAATWGASQVITIGAAGGPGSAGGNTTVGSILTANGGASGTNGAAGAGGTASGGDENVAGQYGSISFITSSTAMSGQGGSTPLGLGGAAQAVSTGGTSATLAARNGTGYGAGAGGSIGSTGASGTAGLVIIRAYS